MRFVLRPENRNECRIRDRMDGQSCILIYTTSQCIFCPGAKEILERMLNEHGLPVDLIREVDCDNEDVRDITALPTIHVCEETIIGLPEEDTLYRALWKLRVNPCFYENSENM